MKPHHRKGFTLVEVIVATTVLLLVVGAALSVFVAVNRSMYGLSDAIDLNAQTRVTQERILLDLRAISAVATATDQQFVGQLTTYGNNGVSQWIDLSFTSSRLVRKIADTKEGLSSARAETIIDNLETRVGAALTSRFHYRNRTGSQNAPAANANEVRAIQLDFVPLPSRRQAMGLTHGQNTPFTSALIQLRNING